MVWVLLNVYEEAHNLPRCIQSVRRVFPGASFVFVDGRYPDFETPNDFSADGTLELCEREGTVLMVSDYECEKRTAGLAHIDTLAANGDWILNLDADETITSFQGFPEGKVGQFWFTRKSDGMGYGRNRLYRWEPGLRFLGRHYDLYDSNDDLVATLEAPPYEPVGDGVHFDTSHSSHRKAIKTDYYRNLRLREGSPWAVPA